MRALRYRVPLTPAGVFGGMALVLLCASGCGKAKPIATVDAGVTETGAAFDLSVLDRAEDQRRAKDIPEELRLSHDVIARRRAARAFARIADGASIEGLMRALSDDDAETAGWGAYGLGYTCKGRDETHVRALVARATSLGDPRAENADAGARGASEIDLPSAIARAMGRCGGTIAEQVLTAWVRARGAWSERAAYALGDLAGRRNAIADETATVLLDAAAGGASGPPLEAAIFPFARLEKVPEAFVARLVQVAHGVLERPSSARLFAIRALGRANKDAAPELARVVQGKAFTVAERAEAARGLGQLGETGHAAAAEAVALLTPDKDPFAIAALGGDDFGVLFSLVNALGADPPKKVEPALYALASIEAPGGGAVPPSLARRLAELRCGAALALARGAFDAEILRKCDAEGSEAYERGRLGALLRRPLIGERRTLWKALARSKHMVLREHALEAISSHPELGEVGRVALAEALESKQGGLVATAADIIKEHPDRATALAASERRAALDPRAPPPTVNPARELDAQIGKALTAALAHPWSEEWVETRANLLDAAASVSLPGARAAASLACHDVNATIRERAVKALRVLGDPAPACPAPEPPAPVAAEIGHTLEKPVKVVFVTDSGDLTVRFEPELAPVAATRFVALARAGFFKGVVVHRVVPGFVVQFGDPGGDGYGGGGKLVRCETSPVPFGPLDVGIALAGRDTGSSQLFVTLARYPHLDGEYPRIGRAEGDWAAVAEGDVVREARVED